MNSYSYRYIECFCSAYYTTQAFLFKRHLVMCGSDASWAKEFDHKTNQMVNFKGFN